MVDSKLIGNFPFLKEIWNLYKFDEDPNGTDDNIQPFSLCKEKSVYGNNPTDNQKNACKKLLKNFKLLHIVERTPDMHFEWCNNINNWIYYEIDPNILNDAIINRILEKAQPILGNMPNKFYCTFTVLNKNHEPQKLNKLRIFNDNTMTFKTILMNKGHDYYCTCINFVNDCIKIYRTFHSQYCLSSTDKKNNKGTCDIVDKFNLYYTGYLYNAIGIQENLPDLSSSTDINMNIQECMLQTNAKGLDSVRGGQSDGSTSSTTPTEAAGKTVPTAIGTIAGVSSVLALLYKFSPARTWMHSGLRGNGKMIHTNLYAGGERELLTGGPLIENLNSYNIGYEVA